MAVLVKTWISCATQGFAGKLVQGTLVSNQKVFPRHKLLRVYHQMQQWKDINFQPQEWGWELRSGKLLPVGTNLPPAQPSLFEVIRCSRETECHKSGLECSAATGACKGISCSKAPVLDLADKDDDDTVQPGAGGNTP